MRPCFRRSGLAAGVFFALSFPTVAHADEPPKDDGAVPPAVNVAAPAPHVGASPGLHPITVVLRADDGRATVERRTEVKSLVGFPLKDLSLASVATWEQACVAPCEVTLDSRYSYRIAGEGLVPSDAFTLPQGKDRVKLDAKMGSAYGRVGGGILSVAGAAGVVLGGAMLVATPILEGNGVGSKEFRSGILVGGASLAGLGAMALVSGLWLFFQNDTTVRADLTSGTSRAPYSPGRVAANGIAF